MNKTLYEVGDVVRDCSKDRTGTVESAEGTVLTLVRPSGLSWSVDAKTVRFATTAQKAELKNLQDRQDQRRRGVSRLSAAPPPRKSSCS
ncbi:hypothetical protein [Streptomyces sp. NPDC018045]|uniref:hypothetical protein n=1 Tax=Streptomyces sp. NPDC018045 TaxID=3365037 RepID=UPI00378CEB29